MTSTAQSGGGCWVDLVGDGYLDLFVANGNLTNQPNALYRNLRPGGRAALQYIAIDHRLFDAYSRSADFIQAYIFPGGMLLHEPRFADLARARGLSWRDRDGFGGDYAETLRRWRERFDAAVRDGRLDGFSDEFHRLWRYYLMYCEGGFRGAGIDVAQVTLGRQ